MKQDKEILGILRGFDDFFSNIKIINFKRYGYWWCHWIVNNIILFSSNVVNGVRQ
jgi:hypothetical protein